MKNWEDAVAVGTTTIVETLHDGWTMVGNKGGFMAQHEHTIVITDKQPIILTDLSARN